jgi:hypothetical protein
MLCSETSQPKIQLLGNPPDEKLQISQLGEILKSRKKWLRWRERGANNSPRYNVAG